MHALERVEAPVALRVTALYLARGLVLEEAPADGPALGCPLHRAGAPLQHGAPPGIRCRKRA